MSRTFALALALLTALTLACSSAVASAPVLPATLGAQSAVTNPLTENAPAFSGSSAFGYVDALSNGIGSRVAGSDDQSRAQQYLLQRYTALGYQAQLQPFTVTFYDDRGSSVSVNGGSGPAVSVNTLHYSAAGSAEGEIVEAGLGRAEDYEDAAAAGKIALVSRGDTRFGDKVEAATAAGVRAVIIVNNQPGNFNGSLLGMSTIPAVSVSQADGAAIRQAIRAGGATARVDVNANMAQKQAANVVATRPGGSQTLVIGGHFDSVAAGPGANDNASGTAVALELARVMASRPTPYTLQFVAFDAEEIGLLGSAHFVGQLSEAERRSIVAMVNLDMVGVGDRTSAGGSPELVRLAQRAGAVRGLSIDQMGEVGGGSDHASFIRAGVPALFIYRSNDPNYHSPNDRPEYVDPRNLQLAGDLTLDVVTALEQGALAA